MENKKIRMLWVGDAIAQTGFARVTHSILDNLPEEDYDINVLGINYLGDPHDHKYNIWPARLGGDYLGYKRIVPITHKTKPDIVVLFNDIWVINEYVKILRDNEYDGKIMVYFPVDAAEYDYDWVKPLYSVNRVLVYTNWAESVLRGADYKGDCYVVPHGVDKDTFFPVEDARNQLEGLNEEDFIVFNGNRNQPRKRIDITIKGFCNFAMDKPDARLYLHMAVVDSGWNIIRLMQRECKKRNLRTEDRLVLTDPKMTPQSMPPVETLNVIYNTANVGVNTSLGEGWGLVSFEQSACGVSQIVPDFSATKELYTGRGLLLPVQYRTTATNINTEGGLVHEDDLAERLNQYYHDRDLLEQHASDMYKYVTSEKFDWTNVAKIWDKHIKETLVWR